MCTSLSTVVGSDTTTSKEKTEITKKKPPQRETPGGVGDRRPPLILISHNFANDMRILDEDGIDLHDCFDITGIADTQVLVEESENTVPPRSLSGLVLQYQLVMRARKLQSLLDLSPGFLEVTTNLFYHHASFVFCNLDELSRFIDYMPNDAKRIPISIDMVHGLLLLTY